ncbi:MAG: HAD-IC family P-type ATPase [Candidatus Lokiarchaeota archaeon]|nr:HAD-IC family P-type ATPase [Candidatus Lokiarchaeota archaeon]MBD3200228.1 HAD-IC family P-type ATPase [Candidatus Lokiarchaeota archaeon]
MQESKLDISLEHLKSPWKISPEETLETLSVNVNKGLNQNEIKARRTKFGSNKIEKKEKKSALEILVKQLKSIIIILLIVASVISFIFGELIEGIAISAVIVINTLIGFFTELKAARSMEALYELTKIKTRVLREGNIVEIPADDVVVGDIIVIDSGDLVPADLRILESSKLQSNESSLTGESVPVNKQEIVIENEEIPLAERKNMLYKGTAITRGTGKGIVIAVGEETELGKISTLVQEAGEGETPLTQRLQKLGRNLFWVTLVIAAVVGISGIIQNKDIFLMIESALALAIATVPEGLPVVATISLARGMWRMAEKNALINRLSSVETLGSTNIICTDKTGTLTENRMTVIRLYINEKVVNITGKGFDLEGNYLINDEEVKPNKIKSLQKIIITCQLCNNASIKEMEENSEKKFIGEPLEVALLVMGLKAGIKRKELLKKYPEVREESFDPKINRMATVNEYNDKFLVSVKGAPESVLNVCNSYWSEEGLKSLNKEIENDFLEKNKIFAKKGLRIIAAARKETENKDIEVYSNLEFLGLVALLDPARKEVKPAIEICKNAGINIIMITGDQAPTAQYIGKELGLTTSESSEAMNGNIIKAYEDLSEGELEDIKRSRIFARVEPEQKLNLIDIYQKDGSVVAMTGDGVNDAPALRKANIGVAMGKRGTQVAQEAADMILEDDNFETITSAVKEGRIITDNIKKFVIYLLSCNISEILLVLFGSLLGLPLPILPLQILFLNVVTDIFPAFALTAGEGTSDIMKQSPRDPDKPIITNNHWLTIGIYGFSLSFTVLGTFSIALFILNINETRAITISFLTLAFVQLWHVLNMRNYGSKLLKNEVITNKYIWGAIILSAAIIVIATYVPGISFVLKTVNPQIDGWSLIILMSLIPLIIGQIWKSFGNEISIF